MLLLFKIIKGKEMKKTKEDLIKTNNEINLPKIINTEVNLLIFPFFILL